MSKERRILIVGDSLVDKYSFVEIKKYCQENSKVPIWDIVNSKSFPGGALNVVKCVGEINNSYFPKNKLIIDFAGPFSYDFLYSFPKNKPNIFRFNSLFSFFLQKERFVLNKKNNTYKDIIARVDSGKTYYDEICKSFEEKFINNMYTKYDCVIISDYCKGVVTDEVAKKAITLSDMIIVDTKNKNLEKFFGATILNVNLEEFHSLPKIPHKHPGKYFKHTIITKGKLGASLFYFNKINDSTYKTTEEEFTVNNVDVVDVTGCGDVFTSSLGVAMSYYGENYIREAIKFANKLATKAVTQFGPGVKL